jgi:hypothetical protein
MIRKLAGAGFVTMLLAGTVLAGGLPAQAAQVRPGVAYGHELVYYYYNDAQHTTLIGEQQLGSCGFYVFGTTSSYYTRDEYTCPS